LLWFGLLFFTEHFFLKLNVMLLDVIRINVPFV
jgi:hypothetical protein